ncbi:MarR family transcriptional regulator [Paenibacillus ehimensis]|uniref:MarR family winged helix-turn-helix transcriptional regulator n=1 Tax=Paenibacillus ehimensis TaxID=79264 RepID=UPI003D2D682A
MKQQSKVTEDHFAECPFFNVNWLSRVMNRMAEEEFAPAGLSPTYAFLLMVVKENPGITQRDLSETLHIAPSTSTRFIDKLVVKGLVERRNEGKLALIYPTEEGLRLQQTINQCWHRLMGRFMGALGEEGQVLTGMLHQAAKKLDSK